VYSLLLLPVVAQAIVAFVVGALFKLYICIPAEGSPFTRIWRVLKGEPASNGYVDMCAYVLAS
jgi:hypothetical protein